MVFGRSFGEGACPQWPVTEPKQSPKPKRPLPHGCSIYGNAQSVVQSHSYPYRSVVKDPSDPASPHFPSLPPLICASVVASSFPFEGSSILVKPPHNGRAHGGSPQGPPIKLSKKSRYEQVQEGISRHLGEPTRPKSVACPPNGRPDTAQMPPRAPALLTFCFPLQSATSRMRDS